MAAETIFRQDNYMGLYCADGVSMDAAEAAAHRVLGIKDGMVLAGLRRRFREWDLGRKVVMTDTITDEDAFLHYPMGQDLAVLVLEKIATYNTQAQTEANGGQ